MEVTFHLAFKSLNRRCGRQFRCPLSIIIGVYSGFARPLDRDRTSQGKGLYHTLRSIRRYHPAELEPCCR